MNAKSLLGLLALGYVFFCYWFSCCRFLFFLYRAELTLFSFFCSLHASLSTANENMSSFFWSKSGVDMKLYDLWGESLIFSFLTLEISEWASNYGLSYSCFSITELLFGWKFFNISTESKFCIFYLFNCFFLDLFNDFLLKSGVWIHSTSCLLDFLPTILNLVFVCLPLQSSSVFILCLNSYRDILSILSFALPINDKGLSLLYLI